ncbi:prolyl oligopeptidase family serine peptidase [Nakamurella sp. YIM 132087]|uniref:Prolyl oligopeptidase family serine peptidase n=1 Tax=Nakamurella alba TaxID=2665158 RepID=A0A7K1FTX0_9ACTN|nr:alpha/beta hydrolase-fold protein [Nakamurella alba]MTD16264.1 prolyl oligopeptidase family serine peptidase [Nakamurella alba]
MAHRILDSISSFEIEAPYGTTYHISTLDPVEHDRPLPVVLVLDADLYFGIAAQTYGYLQPFAEVRTALVVGIGYGTTVGETIGLRTQDLTPPVSTGHPVTAQVAAYAGAGEADRFLDLLTGPVLDALAERYPTIDRDDVTLIGHSLGGLLVGHALLTRPGAFRGYCLLSPSVWWDDSALLSAVPASWDGVQPQVFVSVGGQEQDLPDEVPAGRPEMTLDQVHQWISALRMVDGAADLVARLRAAGLPVEHRVFDGESHSSVVPPAITRSLLTMLSPLSPLSPRSRPS